MRASRPINVPVPVPDLRERFADGMRAGYRAHLPGLSEGKGK